MDQAGRGYPLAERGYPLAEKKIPQKWPDSGALPLDGAGTQGSISHHTTQPRKSCVTLSDNHQRMHRAGASLACHARPGELWHKIKVYKYPKPTQPDSPTNPPTHTHPLTEAFEPRLDGNPSEEPWDHKALIIGPFYLQGMLWCMKFWLSYLKCLNPNWPHLFKFNMVEVSLWVSPETSSSPQNLSTCLSTPHLRVEI